jgi:hypothetical protein
VSRYALIGARTGELLTYGGRVIVHDNRAEMEYLFPNRDRARVIRVTDGDLGQPVLQLRDHPSMSKVRFPLRREDFVHAG